MQRSLNITRLVRKTSIGSRGSSGVPCALLDFRSKVTKSDPQIDFFDPRTWTDEPFEHRIYMNDAATEWAVVDEEDWHFLVQWRWCIKECRAKKRYARRAVNRWKTKRGKRGQLVRDGADSIYLHIEVMKRSGKRRPSKAHRKVDHKDGDTMNCRRSNLRWATDLMNNRNRFGKAAKAEAARARRMAQ